LNYQNSLDKIKQGGGIIKIQTQILIDHDIGGNL